ncbi:MAG: Gfo/Idh/MocA family oxidoreductase [Armatimonadetes bacterium]|nr:Gfo/Idh/MocA family oxidoreductase [Armatimonadota bacterium]
MEAVRTGFVGCGAHATANLYPLLHEAGLDLAAVCDLDKRKAQRVCRLYGGRRCYQDLGNMIEEMDLDAALVCGPPEMHAEAISRALAHGIHVWSESPPAPSMAEAERLAEMAREHRLIVQVGLVMRFAPAYVRLKRSLEAEEFGQPVAVEAHLCTPRARSHEAHLMLECLNMLDLLRHLMGEVSALSVLRNERRGQVTSAVNLRFASGAVGILHLSSLQPRVRERVTVWGEGTWAQVEERVLFREQSAADPGEALTWAPDLAMQDAENSTGHLRGYLPALAHFAEAVRGEAEPTATMDDALAAMRLAEAIRADEGELIEVG